MSVDIGKIIVGKCYKLESSGKYLGILTEEPQIMGSGEGRETTGIFDNNGKLSWIPRWENYNAGKKSMFIEVPCLTTGGRRRSRKTRQKRRRTNKRR